MWYLILWIPDLCLLTYFYIECYIGNIVIGIDERIKIKSAIVEQKYMECFNHIDLNIFITNLNNIVLKKLVFFKMYQ